MAVTYTCLYSELNLKTPEKFESLLSVNYGTLYSSAAASGSFGATQLNAALLAAGYNAHETASQVLYVSPMPSRDGTVLPLFSGTFVANAGFSGSVLKALITGSLYHEGADLSDAAKTAYILVGAKR